MAVSIEVPEDISFGYVTDHVLLAVGDGDDEDDHPDAIAAEGSVTFTPVNPNVAVHGGDATIAIQPITATVRESDGRLTYNGKAGVWLVVGDYKVRWALKGAKITDATIRVTADHTPENPLVLARQIEITPSPTVRLVVNEELYRRTEGLVEEVQGIVSDLSGTIESEIVRITSEGDYRGPSAYQVAVEEGFEGTEAEWLATLVGPEGAASTVPGPPGAVPTAADYAIVGPGRPDVPATTGGLVSAATPVGATYTSTDGAGVGAFVWRKRPDGSWAVVDGDTGWRDITGEVEYEDTPLDPWTLSYRLRDTGMTVMLRTTWLGGLGSPSIPPGTILWTPPAALEISGSPIAQGVRNGLGVTVPVVDTQTGTPKGGIVLAYRNDSGDARFCNIAVVGGTLEGRGVATLEYMHTSWPNALPGTN